MATKFSRFFLVLVLCAITARVVQQKQVPPVLRVDGVALGENFDGVDLDPKVSTIKGVDYQDLMDTTKLAGTEVVLNDDSNVVGVFGERLTIGESRIERGQSIQEVRHIFEDLVELNPPSLGDLEVKVRVRENKVAYFFLGYRGLPVKADIPSRAQDLSIGDDERRMEKHIIGFCHGMPDVSHPQVTFYLADVEERISLLSGTNLQVGSETLELGASSALLIARFGPPDSEYRTSDAYRGLCWEFLDVKLRITLQNDKACSFCLLSPDAPYVFSFESEDGDWVNL